MPKKICFVVMGYGKKTDYPTGRVLDLDASYRNMIKPAVEEAGLKCVRADEIVHSGPIDVPMYEQLLTADVVIADLSTLNPNAFYELGVRHALRPFTTIIIAEEKLSSPFDVNHIVIRRYQHLGEDVGVTAATKFKAEIVKSLKQILSQEKDDSPVYTHLKGLRPPLREAEKKAARKRLARALAKKGGARSMRKGGGNGPLPGQLRAAAAKRAGVAAGRTQETLSNLMKKADEAQKRGAFAAAADHLTTARKMMKPKDGREEDPYIVQRLALATYKSKKPTPKKALEKARSLLAALKPESSNDTETLGLWGAVHKRLWEETGGKTHLDEAIRGYERGFHLRNDYYNGINLAFLLNARAAKGGGNEAIADFYRAQQIRREVIKICHQWMDKEKRRGRRDPRDAQYWVAATLAEAYLGIGDEAQHKKWLKKAYAMAPAEWLTESTREQLEKLETMMAAPPVP